MLARYSLRLNDGVCTGAGHILEALNYLAENFGITLLYPLYKCREWFLSHFPAPFSSFLTIEESQLEGKRIPEKREIGLRGMLKHSRLQRLRLERAYRCSSS